MATVSPSSVCLGCSLYPLSFCPFALFCSCSLLALLYRALSLSVLLALCGFSVAFLLLLLAGAYVVRGALAWVGIYACGVHVFPLAKLAEKPDRCLPVQSMFASPLVLSSLLLVCVNVCGLLVVLHVHARRFRPLGLGPYIFLGRGLADSSTPLVPALSALP